MCPCVNIFSRILMIFVSSPTRMRKQLKPLSLARAQPSSLNCFLSHRQLQSKPNPTTTAQAQK
jgi:hypothetical protein